MHERTFHCHRSEESIVYGLPLNIDLSFLAGKVLLQICFGANEVVLNFDGNVTIVVTSSIACRKGIVGHLCQKFQEYKSAAAMLLEFLQQVVTSAQGEEDGTLTLTFDDSSAIVLYDDSEHYESYIIKHGNGTIVV
jgi:hypothetical protein